MEEYIRISLKPFINKINNDNVNGRALIRWFLSHILTLLLNYELNDHFLNKTEKEKVIIAKTIVRKIIKEFTEKYK